MIFPPDGHPYFPPPYAPTVDNDAGIAAFWIFVIAAMTALAVWGVS